MTAKPPTPELPNCRGPVLQPGDPAFNAEKAGYNLSVEHHPLLVVGATGAADVISAVNYARARGVPVGIQATGHGITVPADGAVLINTQRMTGVRVDPARKTVRIDAGVRWGQVVHEAAAHGLAPLNGSAPEVGAISYVLGGGVAMLGRRFGYAVDHVRELDVVTADGKLRQVSAESEPDLFWALRGSKGNHGAVVSLEIDLMPVTHLYGGGMYFGADDVAAVLHAYCSWVETLPDEMGSSVLLIRLPDVPAVPAPIRGRYVIHVRFAWSGPLAEGERWVAPMRVAKPLIDSVREMPYREVGSIHQDPTFPVAFHAQNSSLGRLDEKAVDALLDEAGPGANAPYFIELRHFGGALSRPPEVPNAIGRRDAHFSLYSGGTIEPGKLESLHASQKKLHARMRPWGTGGVCVNFLSGPQITTEELASGYLPEDFARLGTLKKRYDPDNLFRINHNIPPR